MRYHAPFNRLVVCTAVTGLLAATVLAKGDRHVIEGIVVRVNDRILTISDMRMRAVERAAETGKPLTPDQYPELVNDAADELCLLERAAELKIEVPDEEVDGAIKQLREQNRIKDEAAFEHMLQSMGMTLDQLKRRMRDTMLVNRVLGHEVGDLPVTEEELKQRYEREKSQFEIPESVHLEHIILPIAGDESDEAAKMADARRLVAAARSAGNFLQLVNQEVKAGHGSGGDLGVISVTDLRPEVRDAIAKVPTGGISDPFVSAAGVHVVRVVERIPPSVRPFKDVVAELREAELAERYRAKLRSVVDGLKKRYVVETHPELFTPAS